MGTLLDLAAKMELISANIAIANSARASAVAAALVETLVYRTPVDTSMALSNWQVTLGSPAVGFIPAYVPGYLGYTMAPSARAAIDAANSVLETKQPGQTIYITNNTPYIVDLNSGTSKQAPAGFVETAVLVARKSIPDIKVIP